MSVTKQLKRRVRAGRCGAAATALCLAAPLATMGSAAAANLHPAGSSVTIKIAVVSNPDMETIEQLTKEGYFSKVDPGINVEFDTLNENTERQIIETDITTHADEFNAVMISNYETPMWAKNGWLVNLSAYTAADRAYDVNDLVAPIREALSVDGQLYSVPFYGESSMVYYRKDLFKAAGLSMPLHPTWAQIASFAQKLNDPSKGTAGICLRGEPGWGENLAALDTVINTWGGDWFNMAWKPQLTSAPDEAATNFYVNLVRKYGEPGASNDGFTECLNDYDAGKAAMWYDATVAAGTIATNAPSVFANTGYAYAPTGPAGIPSGWLYTWSLSIPTGTANEADTWKFLSWATGPAYLDLVGQKLGWAAVPPGTRDSLYKNPNYQKAAGAFANITLASIDRANPDHPTLHPVPYVGVQFVDIPEFIDLGTEVSNQIAGAIAGTESVSQALSTSQSDAQSVVSQAGLGK
ncbi:MAG TPA: sugar ABC transporter substrate-binding protein [Acidimicrobiales bacterium]|nr:sugar ABC transporter substrate-binding protein [Acidimicrobiales bacterium]